MESDIGRIILSKSKGHKLVFSEKNATARIRFAACVDKLRKAWTSTYTAFHLTSYNLHDIIEDYQLRIKIPKALQLSGGEGDLQMLGQTPPAIFSSTFTLLPM